jgi:hypothetical protein
VKDSGSLWIYSQEETSMARALASGYRTFPGTTWNNILSDPDNGGAHLLLCYFPFANH